MLTVTMNFSYGYLLLFSTHKVGITSTITNMVLRDTDLHIDFLYEIYMLSITLEKVTC